MKRLLGYALPYTRLCCFAVALGLAGQPALCQTFNAAALLALEQDPRIQAAVASAQAGDARVDQVRANARPQVSAQLDAGISDREGDAAQDITRVEVTQDVYFFGSHQANVELALAQAELNWIDVSRVYQDVYSEVALAYVSVLEAEELLTLRLSFVEDVALQIISQEEKVLAGLADFTALQALSRREAEANVGRLRAQQAVQEARLILERLLGAPANALERDSLEAHISLMPVQEAEVLFYARSGSPEIALAEQRLRIAEAQIRANNRASNPTIEVYGSYSEGDRFGLETEDSEVGVRVSVPVYQGGERVATREVGEQQRQEALRVFQQEILLIEQNASLVWSEFDISVRALDIWAEAVQTQTERLEAVQNELDLGLTEQEALVAVQADLVDTQAQRIIARYDIIRAQIQVLRVAGFSSPVGD